MSGRDIIVVGASMGGTEALKGLVKGLPADLPASLFVVSHFPSSSVSYLSEILSRAGPLPAAPARDGEPIRPGRIYVAPPDYHLVVQPDRIQVTHGPHENRMRPSLDVLFRTAARSYARRVIAVLLTGGLDDGVAGLLAVRSSGGLAIVQDPAEALMPSLPQQAIAIAGADHVVSVDAMAPLLNRLVRQALSTKGGSSMTDPMDKLPGTVHYDQDAQVHNHKLGETSIFTCPECGGSLWQVDQKELIRFRCHVGHVYYGEQLWQGQAEALEAALWTAIRVFKDRAILSRQLAARERERGNPTAAERFDDQAVQGERYGKLIQDLLLSPPITDEG
jgi:two-component system chemotaxis response regulator CheB